MKTSVAHLSRPNSIHMSSLNVLIVVNSFCNLVSSSDSSHPYVVVVVVVVVVVQ